MEPNPQYSQLASRETIARTIVALKANGLDAMVVADGAAAKAEVLKRLPRGAEVFTMQSQTLKAIGLTAAVDESGQFDSIRKKLTAMDNATQAKEKRVLGAAPDWAIGSVHAVTEDGHLFIASNTGSQLSAYAAGAGQVIFVVGAQKIVADDQMAMRRLKEYSLPLEDQRMFQANGIHSQIRKILSIEGEFKPGRLMIIFVNEKLGF